ncbi:hypothetical protein [Arenibacter certesii]|uniref:RHS repeat protein n=1 Tax=Arenibacter certesii TaxID=228955 RepID=A0A918J3B5_9FLAO|nr:hypothetical protein [Arenibacter certesii]GGW45590.1 hypothetical protein GCM10007383_32490 [Arenibacter certesii]
MYSYEGYRKFQNRYIKGLKYISQQTFYPFVSIIKQPKGKLQATSESFEAFYNKKGKLIHIVNLHPRSLYKYSYDKQNRLTKILEINKETNSLSRENNVIYKDKNNFVEHIREFINTTYERTRQIHHIYEKGIRCVEQKFVTIDEWYLHQTLRYDNIIKEIRDTSREYQEVYISELNKNNQVIKSFNFDLEYNEDGEVKETEDKFNPSNYCLYTYNGGGLIKSESNISNEPWTRNYEYQYNKFGHWIQQITCIDNSLQFLCERKLLYF